MAITEVMMAHRHKATEHGPAQPDDPVKVQIAVVTGPGPEVSLRKEIRLCRAALLYGDAVTLYSPNALMLASVERLGNATGDERFELLRALYPIVEPDAGPAILDALDQLMDLRKRRRRTREQLQLVLQLEQMLNRQWHGIEETAAQLLDQAEAHELIPAMRAGLLELHPLVGADSDMSTDSIVGGLVARAGEVSPMARHTRCWTMRSATSSASICFACRVVGGELVTSDESLEVGFFTPAEIAAMPMHESIRLRIRHYLEHRPQPVIA
jgi:hypothetical protein